MSEQTADQTGEQETGQETGHKTHRVSRHNVMGRLTRLYEDARYLEVGVSRGVTFDRVKAARKVAVDPAFRFDHEARADEAGTEYHQITSDEYFARVVGPQEQFDVIYLDGLHTLEQTLRDLMNALHHLQPQGVIVIDDTNPPTYAASLPSMENAVTLRTWVGQGGDSRWMGDVYRLIWFVDTFCPHLTFRTIKNNHGQTVIWRARRDGVTERLLADVGTVSFEEMVLDIDVLRLTPYGRILRELRQDLGI